MSSISEAITSALQHHQAGRLVEAEQLYRQILTTEPNHVDALHLLGVVMYQIDQRPEAIDYIQRAITLNGTAAAFHNNLGTSLKAHGKVEEAVSAYRRAIKLKPDYLEAHFHLGELLQGIQKQEEAETTFRQLVGLAPNHTKGHMGLAKALQSQGKLDEAIASYRRTLELSPNFVEAHYHLGTAYEQQGAVDQAIACYQRTLELDPNLVVLHYNMGVLFQSQERFDDAIACYRRALALKPDYAEAHCNLGLALHQKGDLDEAIACCRRGSELKPNCAEAFINLGNVLRAKGMLDEAVGSYRRAIALEPNAALSHYNLGNALQAQEKLDEAVDCYRRALELNPEHVESHFNLGMVFGDQEKLPEAIDCYRRVIELRPEYVDAHLNLGRTWMELEKIDEGIACFQYALSLDPSSPKVRCNLACAWLLVGKWEKAWPDFESRLAQFQIIPRSFTQPAWEGESLAGKTILVHGEEGEGLGDWIQFIRFTPLLKQRGAIVIVECRKPLVRLLANCSGIDNMVGEGTPLPAFDVHVSLLSIPRILGTSVETIPADIPYIHIPPTLVEQWRERLQGLAGFKVGINWQGNTAYRHGKSRSLALRNFAPLAQVAGVHLISLQKGGGIEQLEQVKELFPVTVLSDEMDQQSGPFMDTAAVMKNFDLIITSDTAIAHVAGALGLPVWMILRFASDWRWLLDRTDTPWYPTMRLFRQRKRGNWDDVFEEIKQALREQLSS